MSNYQPHWDLTTIPEPEFKSERARRQRAAGPRATNERLRPCDGGCGVMLNATQRRKPCLNCGYVHPRSAK